MTLTSKVYNLAFVNFKHSEMLGKKEFNEPHRLRSYLFKNCFCASLLQLWHRRQVTHTCTLDNEARNHTRMYIHKSA